MTCLICVAATLGDPRGPMNRLALSYGTTAVVVESALLVVSGLLAMTVDRVQTLRLARIESTQPVATDGTQQQES